MPSDMSFKGNSPFQKPVALSVSPSSRAAFCRCTEKAVDFTEVGLQLTTVEPVSFKTLVSKVNSSSYSKKRL